MANGRAQFRAALCRFVLRARNHEWADSRTVRASGLLYMHSDGKMPRSVRQSVRILSFKTRQRSTWNGVRISPDQPLSF